MSSFKEIVTKAVVGKAKKTNMNSYKLMPEEVPNTILVGILMIKIKNCCYN